MLVGYCLKDINIGLSLYGCSIIDVGKKGDETDSIKFFAIGIEVFVGS